MAPGLAKWGACVHLVDLLQVPPSRSGSLHFKFRGGWVGGAVLGIPL